MKLKLTLATIAVALVAVAPAAAKGPKTNLQFLGQAIVPTGTQFQGTTVGGLSSITYDAQNGVYYAISDDPSQFQPARFYTLKLAVADGTLTTATSRSRTSRRCSRRTASRTRRSASTRKGSC